MNGETDDVHIGITLGIMLESNEGKMEGTLLGAFEFCDLQLGIQDGTKLGCRLGLVDEATDGVIVGITLGIVLGSKEGRMEGTSLGTNDGLMVDLELIIALGEFEGGAQ